jgi:CSLREA domain-containing protein
MNTHLLTLPKMVLILLIGALLYPGTSARAATFTVNTTADTVDTNPGDGTAVDTNGKCSLRAAIMEANALYGPDMIEVPEGIYLLARGGTREDYCQRGDLDIRRHLTIRGAGIDLTIIDGSQQDRVFEILGPWNVTISDLTIRNGKSADGRTSKYGSDGEDGGGIYNKRGSVSLANCKIGDCSCGKGGIMTWCAGMLNGGKGGGICNSGILTLDRCVVTNNRAGGGRIGGHGGGIYNSGTLSLNDCRVNKNGAGYTRFCYYNGGGNGGGICNSGGKMTLQNCEICSNSSGAGGDEYSTYGAPGKGGGIYHSGTVHEAHLVNCTISHNSIPPYGYGTNVGGGIYNAGLMSLDHCTVYRNILYRMHSSGNPGYGGGIYNYYKNSLIRLHNSIVAANRVGSRSHGPDCYGTITSLGYNLIGINRGFQFIGDTSGNILDVDPKLDDVADNGGPTCTQRLLSGSPAIDAADPEDFADTDQRGIRRPKDGSGSGKARADIGAFEVAHPEVQITAPMHGAAVNGTSQVKVSTNMETVAFYVNGKLAHTADGSPYTFKWDTTPYANGSHWIKAKAYDIPEQAVQDKILLNVQNIVIHLTASRRQEKSWLTRKEFGLLYINVENTGMAAAAKYVIHRKEGSSAYTTLQEIPAADLQGNAYTYRDLFLKANTTYTYRVLAVDGSGMVVGRSGEKGI